MEVVTNDKVRIQVDSLAGTLSFTKLLAGTLIYIYNDAGVLQFRKTFTPPSLTVTLEKRGGYVVVMNHSSCSVVAKRFIY
ncbi:MAG: hypothetical protein KA519_11055 [Bacteroides sp.]|uniref:hypothetical protein n=1 Tax=Bacteroides sp. TaxID=29523 RepID=UPI001B784DCC|nr:hypothetical protein [Bacteroides sp.]MBP6068588.1 hypothetical protein [Bacteroides sp.]MBP9586848.1 hypothetical protein [Bacteroides sp.]